MVRLTYETLSAAYEGNKSLPKRQNKCIVLDDMAAYLKSTDGGFRPYSKIYV
jgi:hypothetical protein